MPLTNPVEMGNRSIDDAMAKIAAAMPEDKFGYKSTPAQRSFGELGRPLRALHVFLHPGTSWMTREDRDHEIADQLGHGDYYTVAAHNLAVVLIRCGRVLEARAYLDAGERAAREHALDTALFRIEAQQCQVLMLQGAWDEAEQRLRQLLQRAEDPGANLVNPLAFLGRILARRGDPEADALVDRAWAIAAATGEDQKMAVAAGARIERAWLAGDEAAVRALGAELLAVAIRAHHWFLRGELLRYLHRAGEPVEPFPGCLPAFAAGIAGDWQTAARLWLEAGNPYERALELTESPSRPVALEGLRILDRLGAVATAGLVRRRLRRVGVRGVPRGPRATTRANPARLTDRQLDVLALLIEEIDFLQAVHGADLFKQRLIYTTGEQQLVDQPGVVQKTLLDQILQESVPDDGVSNTGLHRLGQCGSFLLSLAQQFLLEPLSFKKNIEGG